MRWVFSRDEGRGLAGRFFCFTGFTWLLMMPVTATESHIVVDAVSGQIWSEQGADVARPVASLTKVASALVVLEWADAVGDAAWEVKVPLTAEAVAQGANHLSFQAGDVLSLESALFASAMASDNVSAWAMAEVVGKSVAAGERDAGAVEGFVARMNELARRLGMQDTQFINPTGLDLPDRQGVSTAADLARLAVAASRHPQFLRFASVADQKIEVERSGKTVTVSLTNTNELLGKSGVLWGKTGTTRRAGACLVTLAQEDAKSGDGDSKMVLVSVLLDSPDRFSRTKQLLDQAFSSARRLRSGEQEHPAFRRLTLP